MQGHSLLGAVASPAGLAAEAPAPLVNPLPKNSNSSGSRDSDGRPQRRFVSPFAQAAAPIALDDDADSDSKSASVHMQKGSALSPTSSMTQPLPAAMTSAGQVCQHLLQSLFKHEPA